MNEQKIDLQCWGTQAKEISQGTCPHIKCNPFQSLNRAHSLSFLLSEKLHRKWGREFDIPPHLPRSLIRGMQYNLLFYCGRQFWITLQNQRYALSENCCDLNWSRLTLYYTSSKNDCTVPVPKGAITESEAEWAATSKVMYVDHNYLLAVCFQFR